MSSRKHGQAADKCHVPGSQPTHVNLEPPPATPPHHQHHTQSQRAHACPHTQCTCAPAPRPQVQEQLKPLVAHVNQKALDQFVNFTEQRDDLVRRKQVGLWVEGRACGRGVFVLFFFACVQPRRQAVVLGRSLAVWGKTGRWPCAVQSGL